MVLAFATGLGGGIVRDVLIGALPPNASWGWTYGGTAFLAGAIAFGIESHLQVPRGC